MTKIFAIVAAFLFAATIPALAETAKEVKQQDVKNTKKDRLALKEINRDGFFYSYREALNAIRKTLD